jgi:hypothetical protein
MERTDGLRSVARSLARKVKPAPIVNQNPKGEPVAHCATPTSAHARPQNIK